MQLSLPSNVLDPGLYQNVRLPLLDAEPLPPWCYTDQEFYRGEVEKIFFRHWNFMGHEDMVPTPGSYFATNFVGVPLVIVRDKDLKVKTFVNSCRHRGTPLVSGSGKLMNFSCPYHAWVYTTDGKLVSAPGMEATPDFPMAEYGLKAVRTETWGKFIFVNFDDDAQSLKDYLGNMPAAGMLGSYNFDDMVLTRRKEYDLKCNWKAYVENAMEDYHTATVHKGSIGLQLTSQVDSTGEWVGLHMPHEGSCAVLSEDKSTLPFIPSLEGLAAEGTFFALLYPSTMFGCTRDCAWWLELQPNGPDRTKVILGTLFPKSTTQRPDFAENVKKYYKRWDKSLPEDNLVSELQHRGLSPYFKTPGRFSSKEPLVHIFGNWVLDKVVA